MVAVKDKTGGLGDFLDRSSRLVPYRRDFLLCNTDRIGTRQLRSISSNRFRCNHRAWSKSQVRGVGASLEHGCQKPARVDE